MTTVGGQREERGRAGFKEKLWLGKHARVGIEMRERKSDVRSRSVRTEIHECVRGWKWRGAEQGREQCNVPEAFHGVAATSILTVPSASPGAEAVIEMLPESALAL